jgi:hypothetical protein
MPRVVPSQVIEFIDRLFDPQSREAPDQNGRIDVHLDRIGKLATLAELAQQVPADLITLSAAEYGAFMCSLAQIREVIQKARLQSASDRQHFPVHLSPIAGLGDKNPVTLVRDLLSKCPDEHFSTETANLHFISDESYRLLLRRDVHAVNSALQNVEWKAATVLAGSVIEALLLWAIRCEDRTKRDEAIKQLTREKVLTKRPDNDPDKWVLHEHIEVGLKLGLIKEDTATAARLAKDYRNLIHPGRAIREGQQCNRGTALSAVGGLEHVMDDLDAHYEKRPTAP